MRLSNSIAAFGAAALAVGLALPAEAGFVDYTIRGAPTIIHDSPALGQTQFIIDTAGEKAALGSNDINGQKLGSIANLHIDRYDTKAPAGSGPAVAPYLNLWITDGTNFAVVANEPSNPAFQPLYSNGYDLDFSELSGKVAKIFENSNKSWLPNNGVGLTFADLASFTIAPPSAAQLTTGWAGLGAGPGGGAPRELGTNVAYGVNWVFGDTLSNYVSGDPGYIVANASVTAVPEPGTLALLGGALLGLGAVRRRRKA